MRQVEMVINMEMEDFDDHKENIFRHALAGFLKISPQSVIIKTKISGSVRIILDLPEDEAKELINSFRGMSPALKEHLSSFEILDIREVQPHMSTPMASNIDIRPAILSMRLINRSGQDIKYRFSGGAKILARAKRAKADWTVLQEGMEVEIDERSIPGTLEVQVEERTMPEILLDRFGELVEVGRNLKIKILRRSEAASPAKRPADR